MTRAMLLGGPAAALVFCVGTIWLGLARPGYSAVRQTISELGPAGGEGRASLTGLNLVLALISFLFAYGLRSIVVELQMTAAPAYFVGLYALLALGLAAFPSGHPLHNVVGLLQTFPFVGAPLTAALGWRAIGDVVPVSWSLAVLVAAMILNLAPAFSGRFARTVSPIYGLLQRLLFVAWYGWFAALGLLLWFATARPM